jgi:hypothetical protein
MAWTESPWENPDGAPFGICWEKGGGTEIILSEAGASKKSPEEVEAI